MCCRYLGLFLFLLGIVNTACYASEPHVYQLANGLKIVVKEDHRAPVVFHSIWYKVGGSNEHSGITGISHMLEHMMFRGTERYGPGRFDKIITDNGGQENAMTTQDYTVYFEFIGNKALSLCMELEADRMQHLLMKTQDFKKEQQVVMEERRMRIDDNPQAVTWERFVAQAFVNNPYHHMTAGWMTDIKHLTIDDLRRWYHEWYVPNNAVIVVVGDVKSEAVYQLAKQYFGAVPKRNTPAIKPRREITSLGEKQITVNLPAKLPMMLMGYNTPSILTANNKTESYALYVLAAILGGSESSRLSQDLVRGQEIASAVSVEYDPYNLYSNLMVFMVLPAKGHTVNELTAKIKRHIKQLQTQLVDKTELDRVKAQVIAGKIYKQDSLRQQAMMLGTVLALGLPTQEADTFSDNIDAITPVAIRNVAKKYLVASRLTTAVLRPLPLNKPASVFSKHSQKSRDVDEKF